MVDEFRKVLNDVIGCYLKRIESEGRQWQEEDIDDLMARFDNQDKHFWGLREEDDNDEYNILCDLILTALMAAERMRVKCDFTRCDHGMGFAGGGGCPGWPTDANCKAFTTEMSDKGGKE